MLDGPASGLHSTNVSCFHYSSRSLSSRRQSLSGVWSFGSQQEGVWRDWRGWDESETSESKCQRHSPPKRARVFGSRTVIIVPQLILKCQSPTAAHCSYLFLPLLLTVFVVVCFLSFHRSDWQRSESQMEMFRNAGVPPKQKVTTFKVSDNALIKPGTRGR